MLQTLYLIVPLALLIVGAVLTAMQKTRVIGKVLLSMGIVAFGALAALVGAIFSAFGGVPLFYGTLIPIVIGLLALLLILRLWRCLRGKAFVIVIISLIAVSVITSVALQVGENYKRSLEVVNDGDFSLRDYAPFAEDTKAVSLGREASLKLSGGKLPVLDGATALYPIYAAFAQAVYPEGEYNPYSSTVRCTTTTGAYEAIIKGEADVIFAAAPSEEQRAAAENAGVKLKLYPIGREAFVFFVNAKNPLDNISVEDIRRIYSGELESWEELGVPLGKIRAFQRDEGSGSQSALIRLMDGRTLVEPPREDVIEGMGGIISAAANYKNYKNALGFSFRFYATEMVKNNKIKLLSLDGVYPNEENIRNKTYPVASALYAITTDTPSAETQRLIEWVLSDEGQELVEKTGYTPIGAEGD